MTESNEKHRIVVGVDMSQTGDHALREAMRLSEMIPNSELHVTNVLRTEKNLHDAKRLDELSTDLRAAVDQLSDHITKICAPAEGATFEREVVFHVRLGEAASALHQVAVDVDADLIVVGTHGRKGVEKLILGSVAENLMSMARLPVVVAHPKNFEGLDKTERPDDRRPGESLAPTGISDRLHLQFRPRTSHVSGLV